MHEIIEIVKFWNWDQHKQKTVRTVCAGTPTRICASIARRGGLWAMSCGFSQCSLISTAY